MKGKKLLSMLTAGALAVSMVMPAMAADGDTVDVSVTTKSAVLRVTVPTSLAVAVDQFEMTDAGTQVYSAPFTMENNSSIAVKVDVTSTADIKTGTKLLSSKAAVEGSTAAGEAWLAVAAQISDGKYIETAGKGIGDLTEASENVTTFVQGTDADAVKGTASQTFYLKKAVAAYKLLNANESAADISYAQFYELTAETVGDADDLTDLLKDNDVYVAATAASDGQALTFVAKGGTHAYGGSSEIYYTAAVTPTAKASIDSSKLYVYANGTADATDGKAAFRYIGNLSGAQEEWSATDITNVHIKYDIIGVRDTKYNEVKDDCTYGLYVKPDVAPSIATTTYSVTADTAFEVQVSLGAGDLAAEGVSSAMLKGSSSLELLDGSGTFATYENGKLKFTPALATFIVNNPSVTLDVIFNDTDETKVTLNFTV